MEEKLSMERTMMYPHPQGKRVIVLIIDTLMDSSVQAAIEKEKAPALQFVHIKFQLVFMRGLTY